VGDFLSKWFANGTYQFGQKRNKTATNLMEYLIFIDECKKNNEPAFQSVSPNSRIEKIFWEFDSKLESREFTYNSPLLDDVWDEAITLYLKIKENGGKPIIFYSGNRGFHVWVYAFSTQIPVFQESSEGVRKELYKIIHKEILGDQKLYKLYDRLPSHVNSEARIPFSYHQKSGNQVIPLTALRYPFMPKIEDFISVPLNPDYVDACWDKALNKDIGRKEKPKYEGKFNSELKIRQCVTDAMKREPSHYARLAFVMDAIYSGVLDEDIHALLKSFGNVEDYNYYSTQYQIEYQRDRAKEGMKPPTNETLVEWGILKEVPKPAPDPWRDEKKA
jgi:hypothetical protein